MPIVVSFLHFFFFFFPSFFVVVIAAVEAFFEDMYEYPSDIFLSSRPRMKYQIDNRVYLLGMVRPDRLVYLKNTRTHTVACSAE